MRSGPTFPYGGQTMLLQQRGAELTFLLPGSVIALSGRIVAAERLDGSTTRRSSWTATRKR